MTLPKVLQYLFVGSVFWCCKSSLPSNSATRQPDQADQAFSSALVMLGDYPDPSVTKIGNAYWASATSSNWFPAYPLLKSTDLIHWQTTGFIFDKKPDWADYYFWAPELTYDKGKVYVYYTAHKKGGNLCVAVASADRPEGPYRDHGPLVCQTDGSIDAFPMRDNKGQLYLIWKEDGNSVGKPTPIWAQPMNEERTALTGEKRELFRNDAPWESNLVEGVSMMKHGDYFYAFYAAAGCCGPGCTYANGVARAKNLLGPWEKYNKNPILTTDESWRCPGHGTAIERNGHHYFLYHAYGKQGHVYVGRQALLREFLFTDDGWVTFQNSGGTVLPALPTVRDEFEGNTLSTAWNWSIFRQPIIQLQNGQLRLGAKPDIIGDYIGHRTFSGNYTTQTTVLRGQPNSPAAGLAIIGDDDNAIGLSVQNDELRVWKREKGNDQVITTAQLSTTKSVTLQAKVQNGKDILFGYSTDGQTFKALETAPIDGSFLPPWDRGIRVGLTAKGTAGQTAQFDSFVLAP
ncbi:family 43 glycosylhydrolase [Spirosoma soli]|uniref:Family 43 glycosylhydrolase n=1 Tax=Spirosoma soli TaxID=1770529 RepID=A0ABW5M3B1_9BACT